MPIDDPYLLLVFASLAVTINSILILLIIFKSPKSLGSYKYLMIYIAMLEWTYAISYQADKPDMYTQNSAFFVIINKKTSIFPEIVSCLMCLLFVAFYGISIGTLAIHFIYRYLSITNNPRLKYFQSWKLLLWFFVPIINGINFMLAGGIIMRSNKDSDRFMLEYYPEILDNSTKLQDLYYMGPFFWPTMDGSDTEDFFNWNGGIGSLIVMALIFLSIGIMIYFGVKGYLCIRTMISMTSISNCLKNVQTELFYALVFQTLIPVFLMHIPASSIYVAIFFKSATEQVGEIFSLSVAMYPAFNPLPTILIVKSYRKAVKEFFCISSKVETVPVTYLDTCTVSQAAPQT